jgi:hypothetical protein
MKKKQNKRYLIFGLLFFSFVLSYGQLTGFIKTGCNIGTINQEWWVLDTDSIKYEKALLRPILSIGAQYLVKRNWIFRQEVMFQIKGQGTVRPDVRTLFRTENPDILRFMSFPFTVHKKIVSDVWLGVGFQPSLYLSGKDNYYAKEVWRGWVFSGILNIQYFVKDFLEIGFEYDHDFTLYYCPDCDIRFYTYRFYGMYHFLEKDQPPGQKKKSGN